MTGRRAGYCAGYGVPGYANPIAGGFGGGRGWGGRGRRNWYHATGVPGWGRGGWPRWGQAGYPGYYAPPTGLPPARDEASALREQAEHLESALDEIRNRLSELESAEGE